MDPCFLTPTSIDLDGKSLVSKSDNRHSKSPLRLEDVGPWELACGWTALMTLALLPSNSNVRGSGCTGRRLWFIVASHLATSGRVESCRRRLVSGFGHAPPVPITVSLCHSGDMPTLTPSVCCPHHLPTSYSHCSLFSIIPPPTSTSHP